VITRFLAVIRPALRAIFTWAVLAACCELAGLGLLVYAAARFDPRAGLVAGGLALIVVGIGANPSERMPRPPRPPQ
jgi:hypothetical protein